MNHATASGLVTSSATTGAWFHHGKKPGFMPNAPPRSLRTQYPAAAPSRYAALSSSQNGITHSVTLNPSACRRATIAAGSGNLDASNSSSPYLACHRSSISITLRGSPRDTISSANFSTDACVTPDL